MQTTNVTNSLIAHVCRVSGGQPLCKSKNGHIVVTISDMNKWPVICKRCEKKLNKIVCK